MNKPLMKCGHVANSIHNGKPACVICAGISEADEIDVEHSVDDLLKNRKARCDNYGGKCHNGGPIYGGTGNCKTKVEFAIVNVIVALNFHFLNIGVLVLDMN